MASLDSIGTSIRSTRIRFKEIKGFPGYYISSDGFVWTTFKRVYRKRVFRRGVTYVAGGRWSKLRATVTKGGYHQVLLSKQGVQHHMLVHRLVLMAFCGGPPSSDMECCHNNGDSSDNRISNLRWDTKKRNQADRLKHGTDSRGEKQGGAKMTNDLVRVICARLIAGESPTHIAREIGVCRTTIGRIRLGLAWKHIWEEVNGAA